MNPLVAALTRKRRTIPGHEAEAESIEHKLSLANALTGQSMQPVQGRQAGRVFVAPSPLEGVAKIAQAFAGAQGTKGALDAYAGLEQKAQGERTAQMQKVIDALRGESQTTFEGMTGSLDEQDIPQKVVPQTGNAITAALGATSPDVRALAPQLMTMDARQRQADEQRQFQREQSVAQLGARAEEAERTRVAADARAAADRASREQMAREGNLTREAIAQARVDNRPPVAVVGPDGKPVLVPASEATGRQPYSAKSGVGLPPSALKIQNELIEDLGTASNINADLGAIGGQIATGGLKLGPIENLKSKAKNISGFSDETSQKFASFQATLERLRNDSLRLNKGVQTEGDAVRAWNELIANVNDPAVVSQRIGEIQRLNKRAADLKQVQIDTIRANFGLEGLNTEQARTQPAAIGAPGAQSTGGIMRFDRNGNPI